MPLSNTLTYDQAEPHRPTIDELGGGAFQNDPKYPPKEGHPSAEMFNQATKQIIALAALSPSMKFQVEFDAGEPKITQFVALRSQLTVDDFEIFDNGNGDTTINFVPSKMVPQLMRASGLTIVADVEIDRMRIVSEANGWRIKTKLGATGTDAAFTFQVN